MVFILLVKKVLLMKQFNNVFFFILFGVGGATLIRPMFLWSKLKIIFSILIEIGEFIAYIVILPRSNNLYIVATIFLGVEIIFHLINLYATKSNLEEITADECLREYGCFSLRVLYYGLIYASLILFLFLDPDSKFRDTYYEILLILNVFFGISYIDRSFKLCGATDSDSDPTLDETIYHAWLDLTWAISNILATIILITTMVFAGQAIRRHATGDETLKQYDFGVYIYCLVNYGVLCCSILLNGWYSMN